MNRTLRLLRSIFSAMALLSTSHVVAFGQVTFLSHLQATKDSPLYTTYAAPEERSEFTLDKGYHFVFYDSSRGVEFTNRSGGDIGLAFRREGRFVCALAGFAGQPVITSSYPDLVRFSFRPYDDITADVVFCVYSSHQAVEAVELRNTGRNRVLIEVVPFLRHAGSPYTGLHYLADTHTLIAVHEEPPDSWVLEHGIPFVGRVRDALTLSEVPDRAGVCSSPSVECLAYADSLIDLSGDNQPVEGVPDSARVLAFARTCDIPPGSTRHLVLVRSVDRMEASTLSLADSSLNLTTLDIRQVFAQDEKLFRGLPPFPSSDPGRQLLFASAFSLMRQAMLPPEGRCHENYYVFSREPQWGWGHGGQVFHESLTMLAYALLDPAGAMNSQRVFIERQHPDGYINYRTGPYLDEQIPNAGVLTTSAPWFAWENWEVYRITRDRKFLEDAYRSSSSFIQYIVQNRDTDGDGLCEWGGDGVLESVRDGDVAVWDQVGSPENFEALDLNTMLVTEANSLSAMARGLGRPAEAERWENDARKRAALINATMWDSVSGFYYNVARTTHAFTLHSPGDLKRKEIIGFLPLWAGIADSLQARRLVEHLRDTLTFNRRFGVPSLAADDPYYNPRGYWNGPVWVEWNYLIVRGLLKYGYFREARALTDRVVSAMEAQLRLNHDFWEFYSPDDAWAGYHRTYIWAGLVARMMNDVAAGSP